MCLCAYDAQQDLLRKYDKNRDGVFSPEEAEMARKMEALLKEL
jgi:hypothetical protein